MPGILLEIELELVVVEVADESEVVDAIEALDPDVGACSLDEPALPQALATSAKEISAMRPNNFFIDKSSLIVSHFVSAYATKKDY